MPRTLNKDQPRLTRVLGQFDLTVFLIAALVNLNSVPVVAGAGPSALLFWILAFLFFFLPQGVAVLELSCRYPQEGGIYNWSKAAFGNFNGFVSGWCYWTNNIFYVPTLLFYIVGFAAFVGGDATADMGENPVVMASVSLVLLWLITWLNVRGWGVGKWVQACGASGTLVTTAVLLGIGIAYLSSHAMANSISGTTLLPRLSDWHTYTLLGVVCLNFVGLELGAVMGDEIKEPRKTIPRAAVIAGLVTVVLYVLSTFALQATIPAGEIGVIDGILQAARRATAEMHIPWLLPPLALLMSLNAAGNTSAWLAGSARVPYVIGIDRYLPAVLGRIHPRYKTPHVSLIVQGLASSLFIMITAVGSTVHDMYLVLLQTTIILQLLPYLYMFAALVKIVRAPGLYGAGQGFFRSKVLCYAAGGTGLFVTAAGVIFAFLPSSGVSDEVSFQLKTLLGFLGLLIPALLLYAWNARLSMSRNAVSPDVILNERSE